MPLSESQLATLQADILADPALSAIPNTLDLAYGIADVYNALASPNYIVWAANVPTQSIYDAIDWKKLTPTDAPDGTQLYLNRMMNCQGRQFNLQILLRSEVTNGQKQKLRQGLQDALQDIPSGAAGALIDAGWNNVKAAMTRLANRAEKLFVTSGSGTAGTPGVVSLDGRVTPDEVYRARKLP